MVGERGGCRGRHYHKITQAPATSQADLTITMQGSSAPLGLLLSAVAHQNKTRVVRATAGVSQGTVRTQRRAL